ncbi:50S ribosomal protein L16 [Candidatus Kuenenbacteria bacterium RIFCSPHIGHO2_02_FULL_39_13]|uniref:Large ribosomal subunit protein uL16 n=1 Tax=Candidatus Kuenenbacteria bacterium RIFCSPHIGHO2_02_FULL_39_13 TaxID=1798561 RepID=A0A1F6FNV9_9BACT|nr:MAG: 50S ribosomal protein L16 [Candidatus Kuenenbacteria bacterium RIFCSPHIGHO2_02_FULL_39_13]
MLAPKKVKHRKWHKSAGMSGSIASRMTKISYGDFALKAMTAGLINARQIEAVRRVLVRYIRKGGKIWVRIFPDKPMTVKGAEVGMGKGKGTVDHYVVPVLPGQILFEMSGIPNERAKEALNLSSYKLQIKTKFVKK